MNYIEGDSIMRHRPVILVLFLVFAVIILAGCQKQHHAAVAPEGFMPCSFPADTYKYRAFNLLILLDSSASMGNRVGDRTKMDAALDFIKKLSMTLPENSNVKYAIRTFGHNPLVTVRNTRLVKGFTPFHAVGLNSDLISINQTGGQSALSLGMEAVADDLETVQGEVAMLVVSDGIVLGKEAFRATKELKRKYGDRLSIYPVIIGMNSSGSHNMKELAWIGETGFYQNAGDIKTNRGMGDYVRRAFLEPYPDSDGDSIVDIKDECPDTPIGAITDGRGCWVLNNIGYEFDKWVILPEYLAELERVVEILNANPELQIQIQGHTDNVGTEVYNKQLSLKRAGSVKAFLVKRGIDEERLYVYGYGFSRPVTSNETDDGRKMNRRVELQPIKIRLVGK